MPKKQRKKSNIKDYCNQGVSTPVGIIVILATAVIAGGLMWYLGRSMTEQPIPEVPTPTPSPTATPSPTPTATQSIDTSDWKSYESAKVGFSIDVPPEFDVSIDMSNPILLSPYRTRILSPEKEMTVEIYSLPGPDEEYTSFQDFIDREKRFFVSPPKEETIALNSVSGIKLSLHNEYGVGVIILMEKGQRYYKIGTVIKSESQDIYLPIFDKMLSTFKFID